MTRVEEPYDGGPVPLGASVERRNRVGLIVGGSVLLGVGYVYGAMFCGLLGLVPIVGPALRIPYMVSNRDSISIALIALPSLVMQATGLGLLLGGTIGGPRVLVRNVPSSRPNALSWRLSPGAPQTTFGISVSGVF